MNDLHLVLAAADFAAFRHREQRRKSGDVPYVNHPIAVARILADEAGVTDAVTLAAALLHDTIEDTATTREELEREFGADVARVVAEVTDDRRLPKAERKRAQVDHGPLLSPRAKLVKLADKLHNMRDLAAAPPPSWSGRRVQGYFCWAHAVVQAIGDGGGALAPRLEQAFETEIRVDGAMVRAVPSDEDARAALLDAYLSAMSWGQD